MFTERAVFFCSKKHWILGSISLLMFCLGGLLSAQNPVNPNYIHNTAGEFSISLAPWGGPGTPPPDVWFEEDKFWASDFTADQNFGAAVDMDGDVVIVGAPIINGQGNGAAYIYERSGSLWIQVGKLTPSDGFWGDRFGESVAIQGDVAFVGAPTSYAVGGKGAAYVFHKPAGGWKNMTQTVKLTAADAAPSDYFGSAIDLDGAVAVIGMVGDDNPYGNFSCGAAYIFVRESGSWWEKSKLIASDRTDGDSLGCSAAISGDYVIVGSDTDSDMGNTAGSAYIYEKPTGGWHSINPLTETIEIFSGFPTAWDRFGCSVAIEGGRVVVGSQEDDVSNWSTGSAYVFERESGTWKRKARLIAYDLPNAFDFGCSVALSGDWVIVGAKSSDALKNDTGAAYFFEKPSSGWADMMATDKVEALDGDYFDQFGCAVSIDGGRAIVGAVYDDDPPGGTYNPGQAGSVYIFYK